MFAAHGRLESEVFQMTKKEIASLLWEFPIVDVAANTILIPESGGGRLYTAASRNTILPGQ